MSRRVFQAAALLSLAVSLLIVPASRAQDAPSAQQLLDSVARTYSTLTSGWFDGRTVVEVRGSQGNQEIVVPTTHAFQAGGRFSREMRHESMGQRAVCDGRQVILYLPRMAQYLRHPLAPADTAVAAASGPRGQLFRDPFADFRGLAARLRGARLAREDSVDLGGEKVPCDVVEYDSIAGGELNGLRDAGGALWIEKARHLVLRELSVLKGDSAAAGAPFLEMRMTTSFDMVRVGQPLPDSLFVFVPPAGTLEVERFGPQRPRTEDLSGKPMIDFALKDLAGKTHKLSALKGKVVLIDFWASWCGPCRREMPTIQKLYQAYRAKGLVVLAVNVREDAATAGEFLRQNKLTFTALLDAEGAVAQQYQASAIPTMAVIDRKGRISSHFVGMRSEEDLRAALVKAGL
jgi:thiol-disulfide isomerase/thioredoxin/outer membrane lipoprotein-sorting protein